MYKKLFATLVVAVISWFLLNVMFETDQNAVAIWSGKGLLILFLTVVVQVIFYICVHKERITFTLIGRKMVVLAIVYVFGILIGTVVLKHYGYEPTITPICSFAGVAISLWCVLVSWGANYLFSEV